MVVWVLVATVVILVGALAYTLLSGSFFGDEPRSDLERDYLMLTQGLAKNPKDPAVLMSLAEVEYDLGRESDAFKHAAQSVRYSEEQPYFHLRYATLLVRDGRLDEAAKQLEVEIDITGTTKAEPHFLLAQIRSEQGDVDAALVSIRTGLKIDPSAADMGIVYAQILEKAGEKKEAIENYERALKFLPGDPEAIAGLERLGVEYVEPTGTVDPHGAAPAEGQ